MGNMEQANLVLVDSNLWIDFLSLADGRERSELGRLLQRRIAATTGVVSAEVLYGARSGEHFEQLGEVLGRLHFLETTRAVWHTVAELGFDLKLRGENIALPDLIIAAVSIEHGCPLYTRDDDFQRVPGLRFHSPEP